MRQADCKVRVKANTKRSVRGLLRLLRRRTISRVWKRGTLSLHEQHRLIVASRDIAFRVARKLLRSWNAPLDRDEIDSLKDLALVKAARCYRPEKGTQFISYMYFFLHGELTRAVARAKRDSGTASLNEMEEATSRAPRSGESWEDSLREITEPCSSIRSPEHLAYVAELQEHYQRAFAKLTAFERSVVAAVHIQGQKVTTAARALGFSRGHVSKTRADAFRKLRPELKLLREAA